VLRDVTVLAPAELWSLSYARYAEAERRHKMHTAQMKFTLGETHPRVSDSGPADEERAVFVASRCVRLCALFR
jgi:hypothetical protein